MTYRTSIISFRRFASGGLFFFIVVACSKNDAPKEAAAPAVSEKSAPAESTPSAPTQEPQGPANPATVRDKQEPLVNRGASPYCKPPAFLTADAEACVSCEKANCDDGVKPGCDGLKKPEDRALCTAVLTCARSANCMKNGNLDCYCGPNVDIATCKGDAAKAEGVCKAEITAAYPQGSTAAFIVDNSTKTDIPGGLAMSILQCDFTECGNPVFRGNRQCVPYCGTP